MNRLNKSNDILSQIISLRFYKLNKDTGNTYTQKETAQKLNIHKNTVAYHENKYKKSLT